MLNFYIFMSAIRIGAKASALLLVLFANYNGLTAQSTERALPDRLSVSLAIGASLPVGDFRTSNPTASTVLDPSRPVASPALFGIQRNSGAYATTGINIAARAAYQLLSPIFLTVGGSYNINGSDATKLDSYLGQLQPSVGHETTFETYRVVTVTAGLAVGIQLPRSMRLRGGASIGPAWMRFPDYDVQFTFRPGNPPRDWSNSLESPAKIRNVSRAAHLCIDMPVYRQISMGLNLGYQRADFDYRVLMRSLGQSSQAEVDDTIQWRVFNIGLTVRYALL